MPLRPTRTATKEEPGSGASPRLRFPEFAGKAIRSVALGEVTEDCTDRNGTTTTDAPVMGVSKTDGIVPMEERLIGKDTARYKRLEPDWFAYNPMRLNIGSIARWKGSGNVLVSPDYVVFRCLDAGANAINPDYLDHFRSSTQWEDFVTGSGDGGVRVRIYYKDLARLRLRLPEPAEQQKIADCLSSLDELIAAQGRKVEMLKAHKKGLMQHLFPQEGQILPRLRFPEFRDGPEWQLRPLGGLGTFLRGLTYAAGETADTGLLVLRSGNIQGGRLVVDADLVFVRKECPPELQLRRGDVVICMSNGSKALVGKAAEYQGGYPGELTVGAFCSIFRASVPFAKIAFSTKQYEEFVALAIAGGNINNLKNSDLEAFEIAIPREAAEQQRIADCVASLDAAMAAEADALAAFKAHKKGLTQQIFPSPEVT